MSFEITSFIASDRLFVVGSGAENGVLASAPFQAPTEEAIASSPVMTSVPEGVFISVLANGQLLQFNPHAEFGIEQALTLGRTINLSHPTEWSLAGAKNVLYAGTGNFGSSTEDNVMLAVNAINGEVLWSAQLPGPAYYPASVALGLKDLPDYVIVSTPPKIVSLRAGTGAEVWNAPTASNFGQVIAGDTVYYCSGSSLFARKVNNGELLWQYDSDGGSFNRPAFYEGVIYATSFDSFARAIDAATGNLRWSVKVPANPGNPVTTLLPVGRRAHVHVVVAFEIGRHFIDNSLLVGLNASNGAMLWTSTTPVAGPTEACTDPIATYFGKAIQVGTPDGRLVTVSAYDGATLGQVQLSDVAFTSSPVSPI